MESLDNQSILPNSAAAALIGDPAKFGRVGENGTVYVALMMVRRLSALTQEKQRKKLWRISFENSKSLPRKLPF